MAASTSRLLENGLQVASGMSAYAKNPRELDVPIIESMLISLSNLYQSFYQLLIAKDWTGPAWASRTYTLRRRNNWILRRDMVRMSIYRVPITDLGSKLIVQNKKSPSLIWRVSWFRYPSFIIMDHSLRRFGRHGGRCGITVPSPPHKSISAQPIPTDISE